MNFKKPRDPNTKSDMLILRRIPDGEMWPCFVGSGECHTPAVMAVDDGTGGEALVCQKHYEEMEALSKLLVEMTPKQVEQFSSLVEKAHG